MDKLKIFLSGCNGKMGRAIREEVAKNSEMYEIVGGYDLTSDPSADFPIHNNLSDIPKNPDVFIDFSGFSGTNAVLQHAAFEEVPVVIGTTNLPDWLLSGIETSFSTMIPIFMAKNMSYGINLTISLGQTLATKFSTDISITEKHHKHKVDAPSGTAKLLFDEINAALGGVMTMDTSPDGKEKGPNEICVASSRGGEEFGYHEMEFFGQGETLTIIHQAHSRSVFARGALNAASFLVKQEKGLYSMKDLLADKVSPNV